MSNTHDEWKSLNAEAKAYLWMLRYSLDQARRIGIPPDVFVKALVEAKRYLSQSKPVIDAAATDHQ